MKKATPLLNHDDYLTFVASLDSVYESDSDSDSCRDPSLWETRGTHLTVTRSTCYQPDHHHPDSPKDTHDDGSPIRTASRKDK